MRILHFTKDKIAENLIRSIGTCHAENVGTHMSKSCRPNERWTAFIDNSVSYLQRV